MRFWKYNLYVICTALLFVGAIWVWRPLIARTQGLSVHFFDVGQGDAILIQERDNVQVLIDGGPSSAVLSKLGSAMPSGDNNIELVIMTHPDKDHVAGLVDVLKRYNVQTVLATMVPHALGEYQEILAIIQEKKIPVIIAHAPQRILLEDGSYLDVLYPFDVGIIEKEDKTNSTSVVTRLQYGSSSFLFTGDLETGQETELVYKNVNLNSEVLKVGHHGSKSSTGEAFLDAVKPNIAVISVGKNNTYGHPNQEVLSRLQDKGVRVFRTDMQGDIVLESDGRQVVEK